MVPGVPKLLIYFFRRLLIVPRAPITIEMTDTYLQFQIFCTSNIIIYYYDDDDDDDDYYYYYNPGPNLRGKLQT